MIAAGKHPGSTVRMGNMPAAQPPLNCSVYIHIVSSEKVKEGAFSTACIFLFKGKIE
jgi:hypothetical protein